MVTQPGDLLEAALTYARRGWAVFPCLPGKKEPAIKTGFQAATLDEAQIRKWWSRRPRANIGIATGNTSGFWVLDVDEADEKGGGETLRAHERRCGALPNTVEQLTPSGGRHMLFRMNGVAVRNSAQKRLGPGLDTRGSGGYIIAPPSVHPNGGVYAWSVDGHPADMQPVDAPAWLYDMLKDKPRETPPPGSGQSRPIHDAYVRAAVEGELGRVVSAGKGERNDTLNAAAFALGQFVGAGVLDRADAEARLRRAARAAGLDDQESGKTIDSGLNAGEQQPREMPKQDGSPPGKQRPRRGDAMPDDDPNDSRPVVRLRAGALHELATEAERVLISARAPLYVRSGAIVRPVVEEVEAARGRRTTVARLAAVTTDGLVDWLSRSARWAKFDGRSEAWVPADPPHFVAATVLARDGEWSFPTLVGVITTPTLRPDWKTAWKSDPAFGVNSAE